MKFDAKTANTTRNIMEYNLPKLFTKKGYEAMRNSVFFNEEIPAFETIKKHGLVKRVRIEWVETIEGVNANGEAYRKDIERYWYAVNDELTEIETKAAGWILDFINDDIYGNQKRFFSVEEEDALTAMEDYLRNWGHHFTVYSCHKWEVEG